MLGVDVGKVWMYGVLRLALVGQVGRGGGTASMWRRFVLHQNKEGRASSCSTGERRRRRRRRW